MPTNDLSVDLSPERLHPTPSVRPVETQATHEEAENRRRRRIPSSENEAEEPESGDMPSHQLDHLA